jgi:hypothetical protein
LNFSIRFHVAELKGYRFKGLGSDSTGLLRFASEQLAKDPNRQSLLRWMSLEFG